MKLVLVEYRRDGRRTLAFMHFDCSEALGAAVSTYTVLAQLGSAADELLERRCEWCQFQLSEQPDPHLEIKAGSVA